MAQQSAAAVQNNFTKGLVTEFTGLNFPENAATDCDNCDFTLIGDVLRRKGIDFEENFHQAVIARNSSAVNTYRWNNAGGDGNVQIIVTQINDFLYFWRSSDATDALPISNHLLSSIFVDLHTFLPANGVLDSISECQFAQGNGYLFVYHPSCDPFYCTYDSGTIVGHRIALKIRDLSGVPETSDDNARPLSLTAEHNYNLINQGWASGNPWYGLATNTVVIGLGSKTFTVAPGMSVTLGDQCTIVVNHGTSGIPEGPVMSGTATAYAGTSLTINVTDGASAYFGLSWNDWVIVPRNIAYLSTWHSAVGNYPSNSDVWWYFKNPSGVFDPATTSSNVSLSAGKAPRGHYILDAFSQQRGLLSNLSITPIQTSVRPRIGCWFQGRAWYSGVDAQQPATGDVNHYTWTENIYFSQVVNSVDDFGHCYQKNDPTSETLFDLLPTDGGVIQIQGIGSIYKLHPIQNGLLVFGANGIKFITGSQGVGFSANDYTIIDISEIRTISSSSFVTVNGLPLFWNEEGIYQVLPPQQQGFGFQVQSLTYSTIDSFYSAIPTACKKLARGDYDPVNYTVKWVYRNTPGDGTKNNYEFNRVLNYNVSNKAFYPYSIPNDKGSVIGINYISYPNPDSPDPDFKFFANTSLFISFADFHDEDYLDWSTSSGTDYESFFVTGYQLSSKALTKFQPTYVYVFSRTDDYTEFNIQSIWDYATNRNSNRWSTRQSIAINKPNYGMDFRRIKLRGHGLVLQLKFTSSRGIPFDIMGWSMPLQMNAGV